MQRRVDLGDALQVRLRDLDGRDSPAATLAPVSAAVRRTRSIVVPDTLKPLAEDAGHPEPIRLCGRRLGEDLVAE